VVSWGRVGHSVARLHPEQLRFESAVHFFSYTVCIHLSAYSEYRGCVTWCSTAAATHLQPSAEFANGVELYNHCCIRFRGVLDEVTVCDTMIGHVQLHSCCTPMLPACYILLSPLLSLLRMFFPFQRCPASSLRR